MGATGRRNRLLSAYKRRWCSIKHSYFHWPPLQGKHRSPGEEGPIMVLLSLEAEKRTRLSTPLLTNFHRVKPKSMLYLYRSCTASEREGCHRIVGCHLPDLVFVHPAPIQKTVRWIVTDPKPIWEMHSLSHFHQENDAGTLFIRKKSQSFPLRQTLKMGLKKASSQ